MDVVQFCISMAARCSLMQFLRPFCIHMDKPSSKFLCSDEKNEKNLSVLWYFCMSAQVVPHSGVKLM